MTLQPAVRIVVRKAQSTVLSPVDMKGCEKRNQDPEWPRVLWLVGVNGCCSYKDTIAVAKTSDS